MPVSRIDDGIFSLERFDPARNQYDDVKILRKLDMFRRRMPQTSSRPIWSWTFIINSIDLHEKMLMVTPGDIYEPLADFVYGDAYPKLGV